MVSALQKRWLLGMAVSLLSMLSTAFAWSEKLDASQSSVAITFKQMDVPITAYFKRFSSQLNFNAAHPELSQLEFDIDMTSLNLPAPELNGEVLKKEWFNSAAFPKAQFKASQIKRINAAQLDVSGKLTLKGRTQVLTFRVLQKQEAQRLVFEGSIPLKRLSFQIGEGEWKDTSMVADEVIVKFKIVTTPINGAQ